MFEPNLANLTTQYQQAYLIYCYKVMQYLQALAWFKAQQELQNQANLTKVKPKPASGFKKIAPHQTQEKSTFNPLKHQRKLDVSTIVASGYTDHEMVDKFGIINLGGRIYDSALGRVLQADPFVQEPTNTQSFNRYTYVFNNPLSYTDPSGYFGLRQALGMVVGIALGFFNPFALNIFWSAFVAGFASSIIITGNLKTALKAGLIAGALAFVGDKLISSKVKPADGTKEAVGATGDTVTGSAEANAAPNGGAGSSSGNIRNNATNTTTSQATENAAIQQSQQVATDIGNSIADLQFEINYDDVWNSVMYDPSFTPSMLEEIGQSVASLDPWSNAAKIVAKRFKSLANQARGLQQATLNVKNGFVTILSVASSLSIVGALRTVAKGVAGGITTKGGLNLFKWRDATSLKNQGWKEGDYFMNLPNKGTVRLNWKQNAGRLREEMRNGKPIFDSYIDPVTGLQKATRGFLNAERNLLQSRGWRFDPKTGAYHPPGT